MSLQIAVEHFETYEGGEQIFRFDVGGDDRVRHGKRHGQIGADSLEGRERASDLVVGSGERENGEGNGLCRGPLCGRQ